MKYLNNINISLIKYTQYFQLYFLIFSAALIAALLPLVFSVSYNFEYEYSLLVSFSLYLVFCLLVFGLNKRILQKFYSHKSLKHSIIYIFIIFFVIFFPGLLAFYSGQCPCSFNGFLFWMVFTNFLTSIFCVTFFLALIHFLSQSGSKAKIIFIIFFLVLSYIFYLISKVWFYPQKKILSLFFGFFHGPVYDSLILLDNGLVYERISHLFFALALFFFVNNYKKISFFLLFFFLTIFSYSLSYSSVGHGHKYLKSQLSSSYSSKNFNIFYNKEKVEKVNLDYFIREASFHIEDLQKRLNTLGDPFINIYLYSSPEERKLLFGSYGVDVTDVYTPSIHMVQSQWPNRNLRHELVHALTSDDAFYGLGFHPNIAFTEGLAVALAPDDSPASLHVSAASILKLNRIESIENIFSPFFWKESSSRAYALAGSLISYLIDWYGIESVLTIYRGQQANSVLTKPLSSIILDWKKSIDIEYTKSNQSLLLEKLFRHPSLFEQKCPHSRKDLSYKSSDLNFLKLRQPLGWLVDRDYSEWLYSLKSNNLQRESDRSFLKVKHSMKTRDINKKNIETWIQELSKYRSLTIESIEDVQSRLILSDLYRLIGKKTKSVSLLSALVEFSKKHNIGPSLKRQILARTYVENLLRESNAREWRKYLAGLRGIPPQKRNYPWITKYLETRKSFNDQQKIPCTSCWKNKIDSSFDVEFIEEWYKMYAYDAMWRGRFSQASILWQTLAEETSGRKQELYSQYSRMAIFFRSKKG